jgi:uncharacterized protein YndB with AHSA1/START domain
MSDDGLVFSPHLDACFVLVEPGDRIVFTNALDSHWRPANPAPVSMAAEIRFGDHPQGTEYQVIVRHADARSRRHHEELGFAEGWGTVTAQLAAVAETREGHE